MVVARMMQPADTRKESQVGDADKKEDNTETLTYINPPRTKNRAMVDNPRFAEYFFPQYLQEIFWL